VIVSFMMPGNKVEEYSQFYFGADMAQKHLESDKNFKYNVSHHSLQSVLFCFRYGIAQYVFSPHLLRICE
jgi:hypothetical protein